MKNFLGFEPPTDRRSKRSVGAAYTPFDVIFIIDASNSIKRNDFHQTLRALNLLTRKAQPVTRYAAITFSYNGMVRFNFTGRHEAVKKLRNIPFEAGKTNTQDALDKCRTDLILNPHSGARPKTNKRVLIVTDGQSNIRKDKTLYRAFQLKTTGAQVFVIAIGSYLKGIDEIVGLASSTDAHLYRVANSEGLVGVIKLIPSWHKIRKYKRYTWLGTMLRKS